MITYEQYLRFNPYFVQQEFEDPQQRQMFLKLFDKLPAKIKELLTSLQVTEKVMSAGVTFKLDDLDTEALSLIVRKLVSGEEFIGDGVALMVNETGLSSERARNLLGTVINEIFASAIEDVKKVQASRFPGKIGPVSASSPAKQTQIRQDPVTRNSMEPPQPANSNVINLRNRQN